MKTKLSVALASLCMIAIACNRNTESKTTQGSGAGTGWTADVVSIEEEAKVQGNFTTSPPEADQGLNNQPVVKHKLIKDGNLSVKSQNLNQSKTRFDQLVKNCNAYYESENFENNDQTSSFNLKVRIPAASFERFISGIENGGDEITQKQINTRDVTEEFIDLETRLQNKRLYLKRYREILSRASAMKDIMAIEENIRNLQEELESTEGRLKYLSDQVSFSTVTVNLFSLKPYVHKPAEEVNFIEKLKTALSNGGNSLIDILLWFIRQWPFLLLITVVAVILRREKNKRNNKS